MLGPKYTRTAGGVTVARRRLRRDLPRGRPRRSSTTSQRAEMHRAADHAGAAAARVRQRRRRARCRSAIGALSIVGTFLVLLRDHAFTDVSVFSLNLTTAHGPRPRDRLQPVHRLALPRGAAQRAASPTIAVVRTVRTAGRTVAFSALTVAASLCRAARVPARVPASRSPTPASPSPRSPALGAVVVLPALLAVLGPRVDALHDPPAALAEPAGRRLLAPHGHARDAPADADRHGGHRCVLLFLGAPFLRMQLGLPDDRVLPADDAGAPGAATCIRSDFTVEGGRRARRSSRPARRRRRRTRPTIDAYATQLVEAAGRVAGSTPPPASTCRRASGSPAAATPRSARGSSRRRRHVAVASCPSVEPLSAAGRAARARRARAARAVRRARRRARRRSSSTRRRRLFAQLPLAPADHRRRSRSCCCS